MTNDFPPRAGGIEQFIGNLLAQLEPAEARVLASAWPGAAAHDAALPYRVDRIGTRPLLPTRRLAARVRSAAEAHAADVVVFGAAWPLGFLARWLDRPCFALTHGHEAGMVRAGLAPLVRPALRSLAGYGVISRFTRKGLAPLTPPGALVVDLPPGVDPASFHPEVDGSGVRERHGLGSRPTAACIGRLVRRKGQDVLVEAWPGVLERVPGARLLLVGDGPLRSRLRRRIAALGLSDAVALVGEVPPQQLPAYHAAADVFAMPCRTRLAGLDVEGLGIVYLEAQATGRPVVVGRSGGAPEAVVDGETGVVVDGRSREDVAAAVAGLLADRERCRVMGAAGRQFVEQRFGWEGIAGRFHDALAAICRK